MKHLLLLSIVIISISKLHAQPYAFSQTQDTYVNITNGTSINTGNTWGSFENFEVPIEFSFNYMDTAFTSIDRFEATGRLVFDSDHFYYADMFAVLGMEDKGTSSSLSPLSYELTGASGNYILKIEINNATFRNDLGSTINYQIWLYESDSSIELHMGPTTIVNPSDAFDQGPFSGLVHLTNSSPTIYAYGLALFGSPSSPSEITFTGANNNGSVTTLDNAPTDGTVYRFTNLTNLSTIENSLYDFSVSPNPVADTVLVKFKESSANKNVIEIYSLLGQKIKTIKTTTNETSIDTTELNEGTYFIMVTNDENLRFVKKIIKK